MILRLAHGLCLAISWLITTPGQLAQAAETNALTAAAKTITAAESKTHVDVLADDSFEGREGGSRGGKAAGGYLANELKKLGLRGAGDNGSFFQSFYNGQRNILGVLEGSDPKLKDQYIVIGAHYDHVGYGNRTNSFGPTGYIHNGADDNASGVAGLLEVIQAFTSLPERPKRSIIFTLWDGEEKGLQGSKHWLQNPTVPTKNIDLYINLDMIGRLRKSRVEVYGSRTAAGLRELASRSNEATGLWLDFNWEMKENSDHYSFYERSIPTLMLHTGLHDNYHRPSDDAHLINNEGIAHVARLVFAIALNAADAERGYKFRNESRREDPAARRAFEQPIESSPPRLGVEWTNIPPGEPQPGVLVVKVTPGLAAAQAGIVPGDRLVKFNGEPITSDAQLRLAVLAAKSPVEIEVQRPDVAEPLKLPVTLGGSPVRLGIAWRDDPAEPGTALLTQVVYGSAAHQAGLRERDRIYEIGGQKFTNSEGLRELANTLPTPIDILVERAGVLQHMQLKPLEEAASK